MQEFTIFDMVILGITLVLGLKGLFRGLIKEVFGIIGIIGAIFVASRVSADIGNVIAPILALENQTTIKLIGFIIALIGFWLVVYLLGVIVSKIFSASGLGLFDRIFGFVFGAAKVFLIFSVIAYSLYQVKAFKNTINEKSKGSIVMPYLLSTGAFIIKIDTTALTNSVGNAVDKVVETTKEVTKSEQKKEEPTSQKIEKVIEETKTEVVNSVEKTVEEVKQTVQEEVVKQVEEKAKEATNATQEQIDTVKEKLQSIANTQEENNN